MEADTQVWGDPDGKVWLSNLYHSVSFNSWNEFFENLLKDS